MSAMAHPPPPLISLPVIQSPDEDSDNSDDVMTKEEEEAAQKFMQSTLSPEDGTGQRRLSSLDKYLSQPKEEQESFLLNRKKSLRNEEIEIANIDFTAEERKEKEKLALKHQSMKEMMQEERRRKTLLKEEIKKERDAFHKHVQLMKDRKKRGLGGMTREKRKRLKEMIMNKAHEEMQMERKKLAEERKRHLDTLVSPLEIENLNDDELKKKVEELYARMKRLECEKYDWEMKIMRQELEMHELTQKMSELKGKYTVPVLKKVGKRMSQLEKVLHRKKVHEDSMNMRDRLRNTTASEKSC